MAVLKPDGDTYQLIRPVKTLDSHRTPVRDANSAPAWTGNGMTVLQPDRTMHVSLEPEAWPVNYRDLVVLPDGTKCVVEQSALRGPTDPTDELYPVSYVYTVVRPLTQAQPG